MYESRLCVFPDPCDTSESLMPEYMQHRSFTVNIAFNSWVDLNASDPIINLNYESFCSCCKPFHLYSFLLCTWWSYIKLSSVRTVRVLIMIPPFKLHSCLLKRRLLIHGHIAEVCMHTEVTSQKSYYSGKLPRSSKHMTDNSAQPSGELTSLENGERKQSSSS